MDPKKLFMYIVGGLIFALVITVAILGALLSNKTPAGPAKGSPPALSGGNGGSDMVSVTASATKWAPAVDAATNVPIDQGYIMTVEYDYTNSAGAHVTGQKAGPLRIPVADPSASTQLLNYPVSAFNLPTGATLTRTVPSVAYYQTVPMTSNFAAFPISWKGTRQGFANFNDVE